MPARHLSALALGALGLLASGVGWSNTPPDAPSASNSQCQLPALASFDLTVRNGLVLVPVTIDGVPYRMRLNTAASLSSLRAHAAEKLQLPTEPVPKQALLYRDKDIRSLARVAQIALGGWVKADVYLSVQPTDLGESSGSEDVGTLGMDILSSVDIDLDFPRHRANLYQPSSCKGGEAQWPQGYAILSLRRTPYGAYYFLSRLDGKRLETGNSTGLTHTLLTRETAKRVYGLDNKSDDFDGTDADTGALRYRLMQLSAPPLKDAGEKVYVVDVAMRRCQLTLKDVGIGYANCVGIFPLQLGMSTLKSLHIYLSSNTNVMYFAEANAASAPAP